MSGLEDGLPRIFLGATPPPVVDEVQLARGGSLPFARLPLCKLASLMSSGGVALTAPPLHDSGHCSVLLGWKMPRSSRV